MKSELTDDLIKCFTKLPEGVRQTARKSYKLWQQNPAHPSYRELVLAFLRRFALQSATTSRLPARNLSRQARR